VRVEHGLERFIDAPGLMSGEVSDKVTKPVGVNGSKLFDKNPGGRTRYFDFGTKRCGPGSL